MRHTIGRGIGARTSPNGDPGTRAGPAPGTATRPRRLRTVLRIVVALAVLAVAAILLADRIPRPAEVATAISQARPAWVAIAVVAETVSIGFFASQQRQLLHSFGVPMSLPQAGALSYARSAIAIGLPAGSALSAGFAFRQFRVRGASRTIAATVTILSAAASSGTLVLLYLIGALSVVAAGRPLPTAAVGVLLVVGAALLHSWRRRRPTATGRRHRLDALARRWPRIGRAAHRIADTIGSLRALSPADRAVVIGLAAANWLGDIGCLFAAAQAFDLGISAPHLVAAYLGVQVMRQIPLTPGGIGLIEAGLLAALISAGAAHGGAAGAVLVYRLLSCWLIIPIGFLAWTRLRPPPTPISTNATG